MFEALWIDTTLAKAFASVWIVLGKRPENDNDLGNTLVSLLMNIYHLYWFSKQVCETDIIIPNLQGSEVFWSMPQIIPFQGRMQI